ncbi:MAG: deoxyuridine 5'-triphosphate nucleotidohydrolase [Candidatus Zixiibacteriota bacterium]|jgi:dUTP pyrophosphatase
MTILAGEELRAYVFDRDPPLVTPCGPEQLQPNGVELTLEDVGVWKEAGRLGFDNADRVIPDVEPVPFDEAGEVRLGPGGYAISFRETVNVPDDMCAIARPRSSLLRMGATVATALWDTGYRGRSRALLLVSAPAGIRLRRGARLIQLVFLRLPAPLGRGYDGAFQGEV